ncbi:DUF1877 family protein [Gordonia sp. L191]|uniref:DUF1877 family protein n=1 Tax=Gordonia sp. L191 TaxID=2982699 RepID=UPI0024C07BC8|nr:DUF1877 family protein [Gordonia sp. L191]WHU47736.1 DUF1877 family protein [Gordonia sp. L191]
MSVTAGFTRLSPAELATLRTFAPEDTYDHLEALEEADESGVPRGEGLDQTWDGMAFLWQRSGLTPNPFAGTGDTIELANGGVDVLDPAMVMACAQMFDGLSFADLRGNATAPELARADLYPFGRHFDESDFGYIESWFVFLKEFFAKISATGEDYYLLYEIA